jgi:ABC-2 type transport system permease protein
MRTLRFLLQKEFRQILRNKEYLRLLLISPIIQLFILPMAANYEIKNVNIAVVDYDHSTVSRQLIDKIAASGYFRIVGYDDNYATAYSRLEADKVDLVLEIPPSFDRTMVREQHNQVFVSVNAINGVKALLGGQYLGTILQEYSAEIRERWSVASASDQSSVIGITSSDWYNPHLVYYLLMVPGILVNLLTAASSMSSLNIVKEKESGTIEQMNVTPVRKYQFILSKLIPFWILGLIIFTIGMIVARVFYGINPVGSIWLIYAFAGVYLFTMVGFGMLISTYSETQLQAMSLIFLFVMIFNMMSGLFTPIDSMPGWAKVITEFIPVSYFINVIRMVVLKGSGFWDVAKDFAILLLMGVVLNGWAILNYRKTSG